jgi:hypothetical protein
VADRTRLISELLVETISDQLEIEILVECAEKSASEDAVEQTSADGMGTTGFQQNCGDWTGG